MTGAVSPVTVPGTIQFMDGTTAVGTAIAVAAVFDLLTFAERRLAGTRWDTTASAPGRPVPYRPAT